MGLFINYFYSLCGHKCNYAYQIYRPELLFRLDFNNRLAPKENHFRLCCWTRFTSSVPINMYRWDISVCKLFNRIIPDCFSRYLRSRFYIICSFSIVYDVFELPIIHLNHLFINWFEFRLSFQTMTDMIGRTVYVFVTGDITRCRIRIHVHVHIVCDILTLFNIESNNSKTYHSLCGSAWSFLYYNQSYIEYENMSLPAFF